MTKPSCLAGVIALLLGLACTSDDTPAGTETGTDTQTETETETSGDGDGDTCNSAVGIYGACANASSAENLSACMADPTPTPVCLRDDQSMPSISVCTRRCEDACDCWAAPADGDAPVACQALVAGNSTRTCVLDCSGGQTCPGAMVCLDSLGICVFAVD